MKLRFKAVLFDFDGVIADTMSRNLAAWQEVFRPFGKSIAAEDYLQLEGMGPKQIALEFCRKFGIDPAEAPELAKIKDSLISATIPLQVYPEIPLLLRDLMARGNQCALVTGASRTRIESTLPQDIACCFSVITTSNDVRNTKPHPEPYLCTADKLRLPVAECVVVENAPLGISSARSGGFYCIAITTTLPHSYLRKASEIVTDFPTLRERLLLLNER